MTTTRRVRPNRTTGLGQRLAAALILSALLAAFPVPAQAAPAGADAARLIAPLAGLMSWLEGILADLGYSPATSDGPEAAYLPGGCDLEPVGSTCSDGLAAPVPAVQGVGRGLSETPASR
jgi:hypothetical protein